MLDQIDIPFLRKLNAGWRIAPSLRRIVAAFVEYEPPEPKQYMDADAARAWFNATGGRIEGVAKLSDPH